MKPSRTHNVWGKKVPDVQSALAAVKDDVRTPYHGKISTQRFAGFTAHFWRTERYSATVAVDTGEKRVFRATSINDLREQLLHVQQNLLTLHRAATVYGLDDPPQVVWVARLEFDDGKVETAEAPSEDELLLNLARGVAEARMAGRPAKRVWVAPGTTAITEFLAETPEYRATARNHLALRRWLGQHRKTWSKNALMEAFDFLFDQHCLDEHGQTLDEDEQNIAQRELTKLMEVDGL